MSSVLSNLFAANRTKRVLDKHESKDSFSQFHITANLETNEMFKSQFNVPLIFSKGFNHITSRFEISVVVLEESRFWHIANGPEFKYLLLFQLSVVFS